MGRHTKLTPELQENICKAIRDGLYIYRACELNDVGRNTYFEWLKKGELEGPEYQLYRDFRDATKKAESEDQLARLNTARSLAIETKQWPEAWRYLESRYPAEYGKRLAVQHIEDQEAKNRYLQLIQLLKPEPSLIVESVDAEVKELTEAKS